MTDIVTSPSSQPRHSVNPSIEIVESDKQSDNNNDISPGESNDVASPDEILKRQTMDLLNAEIDSKEDLFYGHN